MICSRRLHSSTQPSSTEISAFVTCTAMHPHLAFRKGRDKLCSVSEILLNPDSSHTANPWHLSQDSNSHRGSFVYLLFQDLGKASSSSHDSLEVHLAALSRASCTKANQETDQKTENLCTKSVLWPRTIEYDWNIKEFLVTCLGEGEDYMLKHKNSLPAYFKLLHNTD